MATTRSSPSAPSAPWSPTLLGPCPIRAPTAPRRPVEAGSANYFTSAFIDRLPDDAIATSPTSTAGPPICPCRPSSTCTTSAARWPVSPPTPPRSPTARRRTSSTASPEPLSRRPAALPRVGRRRPASASPAMAPGAPTSTSPAKEARQPQRGLRPRHVPPSPAAQEPLRPVEPVPLQPQRRPVDDEATSPRLVQRFGTPHRSSTHTRADDAAVAIGRRPPTHDDARPRRARTRRHPETPTCRKDIT